ncbi:hypothetical protein IVB46_41870 [Bradyrhizobium sp. 61]|uniref:DUF6876 family protein n=1 Tax=Bradyrhizobium sp. 61 TaxID=2782679 RepID=UPI001FFB3F53|nr:DUF6876 family protein [Bradyrhizobium sp. 61]MCK1281783.1 hypothetical protein [Bradyrhizobium sp. 61]
MTDIKLADLHQFTGTEQWYRNPLNQNVLFTEGAKYVADQAGAYWLLDEIALAQLDVAAVKTEGFQVWKLDVETNRAMLSCGNGNGTQVYAKKIAFTDFPAPGITLWFTDKVILLPSEY